MDVSMPQVTYRRFDDIDGQRQDVYELAKLAVGEMRPLANASHQLEIADVDYDDDYQPTLAEEKDAILRRKSLQRALRGTVRLRDVAGNVIEEKRMTLAHVPHLNSRGLFIKDGATYALRNQLRLRPGAYTRKQKSGGIETHFNVKPGTGRGFRLELEPESGVFKLRIEQSTTRLYPVLRALGVTDDELRSAWGDELFEKNFREKSGRDDMDLAKLARKLGRADLDVAPEQLPSVLRGVVDRAELDEDTAELTLGERVKKLTPQALVRATAKQLALARGDAQEDNRDSQAFQSLHSAQDLIAERIRRDATGALRNAFWRASKSGSLSAIQPGVLNKNIDSLFHGSGLAQGVEDVNPIETYDTRQAITRLGEGGIRSAEAISREARNIQSSYIGVIDPTRAPESEKIGVDLRVTDAALRGSDGQLYTTVRNLKTGEIETVSARTLSTKSVAFPGEINAETKRVTAVKDGKMMYVPKEELDYEVVAPDDLMSRATRLIPFPEGIKGQRLLMGARMTAQAVALREPDAPNVQTGDVDGSSLHAAMGEHVGARYAKEDGIVTKVTAEYVELATAAGKKRVELYNNYPLARKSMLHNDPVVQVGQPVSAGDLLAKSNYTDRSGTLSIGRNLRTAYMSAEGDTIEDAFVISESAAKKLGAEAMYKSTLDLDGIKTTKRDDYANIYVGRFSPEQLKKIDDDGAIRVGETVQAGDPLVLAVGNKPAAAIGAVMQSEKSSISDKAQVWEHHAPGVVTDVVRTKDGVRVLVKSYDTVNAGDKLSLRHGNKGVAAAVRPDDQMPIAEDGKPIEVIVNTNGVVSRVNPSTLAEALLGKIVERTGRTPYVIKGFSTPEGVADFALNEAERHGVAELETVTDPRDGRKIPGVFVGNAYVMRLHHRAEGKLSARDQAGYTVDGYPAQGGATGSKKISLLDSTALLAAGATGFLKDAKLIRGQKNDDYWRQVRHGETPMAPAGLFADEQFKSMLTAAGVHIREDGSREQLSPLLDSDVDRVASHEITSGETFDFETMEPVKGGLFDIGVTGGAGGNRFAKVTLPIKIPHPLFLDPIRRLLGTSAKEFDAILAGKALLNGKTGPEAVQEALAQINVPREMEAAKSIIRSGKEAQRDAAVKRLHYLAGLQAMHVAPQDLMVSKIAVIPPRYRPIVRGKSTDMIHDYNYLYKDLLEAKRNYVEASREFGSAGDEYLTLMKAVAAVSGTESPVNPKTMAQGVKGVLQYAIGLGTSPKFSTYQRKVIGTSVDTVGRSVITADRHMGLDDVGIPEEMAWSTFRPYIIRRLVQNGLPPAEAVDSVEKRTKAASLALDEELKVRPVVYNRAPALHRYAYQGAWAKRVADDAIHMPYATLKAIGGDFDGNCCAGWTMIDLIMAGDLYDTAQELAAMRTAASTRVLHRINCRVAVEAEIQHIPYLKDTGKVDKNGAVVFDVPPSLRVLSYDHVTGKADFFPVTSFTVDPGKTSVAVSTQRGRSVVVSDNESLVAYNHNTGALEKVAPAHAAGRLVPTIKKLPEIGDLHTFDFGWMCGAFAGDGFVTGAVIGFTKLDGATREFFNSTLRKHIGAVGSVVQRSLGYADVAGTGKLGNSCKPHCNIGTEVLFFECEFYTTPHSQRTGRAALYKKLPNFLNWSMPARIGLLSGLLDTDGSVALNKSRSKPQLLINYATSSAVLRDDVIRLCRSLGINASFSTTLPREGRRQKAPSFTISISSADLRDSGVNLQLRDGAKQSLLDEHLPLVADNNYDFVPVPVDVVQLFCSNKGPFVNDRRARSNWATLRSKQAHYKVARWMALRDAKFLVDVNAPIVKDWLRLIQNRNISWDVVKSVEQAGTITTYDLGVPDTKVFAVNGGLIIQDTVNIHVPSSQEAVDDVKNKLLPSKNLFFTGNFETHYEPMQDYTAGLYLAGKLDPGQKAVTFATVDEAKAAYARGLINARTPIRVLS